jgi:hypothetical protein
VQQLRPFQDIESRFSIEADVHAFAANLVFEFQLFDKSGLFEVPPGFEVTKAERVDGLWQSTCFEAFLKPSGADHYYEFNFSLKPAWNAYRFADYREPQPPQPSMDFSLRRIHFDGVTKKLTVEIENKSSHSQFRAGLAAILLEKNGVKHYCALTHAGAKPDFHLHDSFTLLRGATK